MKERLARLTGGAPLWPLFVLFGLNSVDELDRVAFSVLLPEIREEFGLNLAGALLLVTAITPVTILIGVPVAFYADRRRRTRMIAVGASIWALFSAVTGFAVNIIQLVVARVGSGLGKTVNDPTHNSLLSDYYPIGVRAHVFATHRAANTVGQFIGPLLAGFLAFYTSWRVPFLVAGIPTLLLVVAVLRLHEPVRGVQDRLALGVSQERAEQAETPPAFGDAWRTLYAVRSLRRCYTALPFIGASAFGLGSILSLFYADVYDLNAAERGVVTALNEPFALLGLIVGAPIAQRLLNRNPALVMRFLGLTAVGVAICLAAIALSPNLGVAIGGSIAQAAIGAILTPGMFAVFSVAIPARTRALGFTSASLWLLPGLLVLPVIGSIGDAFGLRVAILTLIPLYLTGSLILASSGTFLASDIEMTRVSSLAEQEIRATLSAGEPKLLMIRGLDVSYDQVQVLFGVDFDLAAGETVALLGTNGAGKSTLLKAISGLVDPQGGAIYFDGRDITHSDPMRTASQGVVQMPGGRSIFPTLTVADHFRLAAWSQHSDPAHLTAATDDVLELFPQLRERWDQLAGNLSGGEQQMLGLSMSLVAKPKLLMIDELSLGLAPAIVEQLLGVVRRVHDQGTAIILVEQSVNIALTVASRAYFMEKGEVRFSGPTDELLERDDILRAVFLQGAASVDGGTGGKKRAKKAAAAAVPTLDPSGGVILEVNGLKKHFGGIYAVKGATFSVTRGEILGLIGPNGAGKTTIFDLISGFLAPDDGGILFDGHDITRWSPDRRANHGLGRSFQDARIFPSLTVKENLAVSLERHLPVRDHLAAALHMPAVFELEQDIAWTVDDLIELMGLESYRDKFVSELSTGTRRMVDLGMIIAAEPTLILFDEPSSGIAQREAEALGPLLQRIRSHTASTLLVIEHDMPLITSISDRMLALEVGQVIAEGSPNEVTRNPRVVSSYLGGDLAAIGRSGKPPVTAAASKRSPTPRAAPTGRRASGGTR